MSWYCNAAGTKEKVLAEIEKGEPKLVEGSPVPVRAGVFQYVAPDVLAVLKKTVQNLAVPSEAALVVVETNGHIDAASGNAAFKTFVIPVLS